MSQRYYELLKETSLLSSDAFESLYNGDRERSNCLDCFIKEHMRGVMGNDTLQVLFDSFHDYLNHYNAPSSYKQRLWMMYCEWIKRVAIKIGEEEYFTELMEDYKPPIVEDSIINVVKLLHREITKEGIALALHADQRTAKNIINRLDPSVEGNASTDVNLPRIGGQEVRVKISHKMKADMPGEDEKFRQPRKYFCTPNTMHPIVLQENLYQVMILFRSLANDYDKTMSEVCLGIAIDIWLQLSEYAQETIENKAKEMPSMEKVGDFLEEIKHRTESGQIMGFQSEKDMFRQFIEEGRETIDELLDDAIKIGRRVNLTFCYSTSDSDSSPQMALNVRINTERRKKDGSFAWYYMENEKFDEKFYFDPMDVIKVERVN